MDTTDTYHCESQESLIIIPARGGSKGIVRKNLQPICDYPMLDFTLRTAAELTSDTIRAVCTTDDEEIRELALKCNIEAPFLRPDSLSTDASSVVDAVRHTLDWYIEHESFQPDWIVLLQPTSPFRGVQHVKNAIAMIVASEKDCLFSVNKAAEHPCNFLQKKEKGFSWVMERPIEEGRQFWPEVWFVNGAIFITRVSYFNEKHRFFDQQAMLYEMDKFDGIDINYPEDLEFANLVYRKYYSDSNELPFSRMRPKQL